jgi:hypothetical protein
LKCRDDAASARQAATLHRRRETANRRTSIKVEVAMSQNPVPDLRFGAAPRTGADLRTGPAQLTGPALRIGLAGLGTVGIGVVKIVQQHGALLAARAGRPVEIVAVSACRATPGRSIR